MLKGSLEEYPKTIEIVAKTGVRLGHISLVPFEQQPLGEIELEFKSLSDQNQNSD